MNLNISFQGLALIQGQIYNPVNHRNLKGPPKMFPNPPQLINKAFLKDLLIRTYFLEGMALGETFPLDSHVRKKAADGTWSQSTPKKRSLRGWRIINPWWLNTYFRDFHPYLPGRDDSKLTDICQMA